MKKFFLSFLVFLICFSGCRFLRGGDDLPPGEDSYTEEEEAEDSEDMWVDEDYSEEEDYFEEEESLAEEDEWSEEGMEESGTKKGFLGRLFGGGKKEGEEIEEEAEDSEDLAKDYDDYEMVDDAGEPDLYVETPESSEETAPAAAEEESVETEESEEVAQPIASVSEEAQPIVSEETVATPPARKSLNKIIQNPYNKDGVLVNAVYIARADETLNNISHNIYSQDKTAELLLINPHLNNRSVVVGDKIYYNSPNRPTDNTKLLFYYEDNNRSPSYYTVSPGENIRDISYRLLGHAKSWKEIWATNQELESKGNVERSISIAYWPASQAVAQPAPAPEPAEEAPAEMEEGEELATEDSMNENNNLPEFPPVAENPDLPPVPSFEDNSKNEGFLSKILNKALTEIEVLIGLLLIIGILIFLILTILKKRRQKDFDYTATNIEA